MVMAVGLLRVGEVNRTVLTWLGNELEKVLPESIAESKVAVPVILIASTFVNVKLPVVNVPMFAPVVPSSMVSVPSPPSITGVMWASSTSATVTYDVPVSNGGATITSYTATSNPGSKTASVSQSGAGTITITGSTPISLLKSFNPLALYKFINILILRILSFNSGTEYQQYINLIKAQIIYSGLGCKHIIYS